ncbi:GNAT family N-acetyltransferase [Emticicia sp. BO119]|uniref:GNAT family N-acetyltransferase n=1 Tax=Emticicia sp. BO119 TaxID=2757768 RepID=UPI0015F0B82B|nr:GNAT family N-acetyltransferase [Emticicia sp. BO119]MBA4849827.1 GNAT family N-acetyltransferase [Emticicia sp. BO119]
MTTNYIITQVKPEEHDTLLDIWESSVRATHHFLREDNILFFKQTIHEHKYFEMVELACVRDDNNQILGFLGTNDNNLEMLFVHADSLGKGIGKVLLNHAINEVKITKVDVNEQNEQAVGFYLHHGFKMTSRSESDGTGKPFPILHMEL